jgi:mxaJ protein
MRPPEIRKAICWLAAACMLLNGRLCIAQTECCGATIEEDRTQGHTERVLRIAADPNNLPFSNSKLEGFENKIAAIIASELKAKIEYIWRPQRRGFFQSTLKSGQADMVLGVTPGVKDVLTTKPYYSSSYAAVSRKERNLQIVSFDAPELKSLSIGVQLIGKDGESTPPLYELTARGLSENVRGFMVRGDGTQESPSAPILDAVADGTIDVAIAWGPLAGWLTKTKHPELVVTPISCANSNPSLPMKFDICLGVNTANQSLRDELNTAIENRKGEIQTVLDDFGIPRSESVSTALSCRGDR